jgi:hypothetical protein
LKVAEQAAAWGGRGGGGGQLIASTHDGDSDCHSRIRCRGCADLLEAYSPKYRGSGALDLLILSCPDAVGLVEGGSDGLSDGLSLWKVAATGLGEAAAKAAGGASSEPPLPRRLRRLNGSCVQRGVAGVMAGSVISGIFTAAKLHIYCSYIFTAGYLLQRSYMGD